MSWADNRYEHALTVRRQHRCANRFFLGIAALAVAVAVRAVCVMVGM
jgi:hypothetical protein